MARSDYQPGDRVREQRTGTHLGTVEGPVPNLPSFVFVRWDEPIADENPTEEQVEDISPEADTWRAIAIPAVEVWCANDANPSVEVVEGVALCSLCLWKMRSPTWRKPRYCNASFMAGAACELPPGHDGEHWTGHP